jgi:hypothetical protein
MHYGLIFLFLTSLWSVSPLFVGGPRCRSVGFQNFLSSYAGLSTVANCVTIVILEVLGCNRSVIEDSAPKGRDAASPSDSRRFDGTSLHLQRPMVPVSAFFVNVGIFKFFSSVGYAFLLCIRIIFYLLVLKLICCNFLLCRSIAHLLQNLL